MAKSMEIMEEDWDTLIILDVCRYDYFKRVYQDYLKGALRKIISPGAYTHEWVDEVFGNKEFDDVVYVSANPHINSKGVTRPGYDFNPRKSFHKVIDAWDWGWDEELGTVHPKGVSKAAGMARARYPRKRLIAHFMQPHTVSNCGGRTDYDHLSKGRN